MKSVGSTTSWLGRNSWLQCALAAIVISAVVGLVCLILTSATLSPITCIHDLGMWECDESSCRSIHHEKNLWLPHVWLNWGLILQVDYDEAIFLWSVDKKDFLLWLAASIFTLFLGIEIGVLIGVSASSYFLCPLRLPIYIGLPHWLNVIANYWGRVCFDFLGMLDSKQCAMIDCCREFHR